MSICEKLLHGCIKDIFYIPINTTQQTLNAEKEKVHGSLHLCNPEKPAMETLINTHFIYGESFKYIEM